MNNMIEKLGITAIERYADEFINLINANKIANETSIKRQYQMAKLIGELEQQRNEMLEALINIESLDDLLWIQQCAQGAIEKATGKHGKK